MWPGDIASIARRQSGMPYLHTPKANCELLSGPDPSAQGTQILALKEQAKANLIGGAHESVAVRLGQ